VPAGTRPPLALVRCRQPIALDVGR